MVNYEDGKIYKIVCNTTGLVYIGSTTQKLLSQRLAKHVSEYKTFLNDNVHYVTSFKVLENSNYEILLIENCKCKDKNELHTKERYHILNNDCVNKVIPLRTKTEYYSDNKDRIKQKSRDWHQNNRNKANNKSKQYYHTHLFERKQYSEDNRERRNETQQIWRGNKKMFLDHLKSFNV